MKTNHTPGPWKWIGSRQSPNERIYLSTPNGYANWTGNELEEIANARLIAAAPDLLAVVERFVKYCTQNSVPDLQGIACDACEALKKVRGE